jgi:SAM-dependent methyltransferase
MDDWDQLWDTYAETAADNPAQEYRRRLILSLLPADERRPRILDIGAGTGELARQLRERLPGAELAGLDVSRSGLEQARRKVPDAAFFERDLLQAEDLPAGYDGWATQAVCSEVLEHVDDPLRLLRNAIPYLAPGCELVVTVPGGPMSAFDRHIGHRRHYRPGELRALLEQAGFEVEHAAGAGFPFFNLYRLLVVARGRRLIDDVAADRSSRFARLVMGAFGVLFRINLDRWGWQTVARARLRSVISASP